MPSMYDPDTLPKVEQQRYYGPTRKIPPPGTERTRNMYTPQDYERHRPQMLQDTAAQFMTEDGGFDQEGFTKAAITNMYQAGDVKGVQEFTRLMKENDLMERQGRTQDRLQGQANAGRRKDEMAVKKEQLQYLSGLVRGVLETYKTKGAEAANAEWQNSQRVAIKRQFLPADQYEETFDPDEAQVILRAMGEEGGSAAPKKASSRTTGGLTEKQRADMKRHNAEVVAAQDEYQSLLDQGWSEAKIEFRRPDLLKKKNMAPYSEVEMPKEKKRETPKRQKVSKDKVKFLD